VFYHALARSQVSRPSKCVVRDVFTARSGTLRKYDPLVGRSTRCAIRSIDARTAVIDARRRRAVTLATSVDRQEELSSSQEGQCPLHNSASFFRTFQRVVPVLGAGAGNRLGHRRYAVSDLILIAAAGDVRDRLETCPDRRRLRCDYFPHC